MTNTLDYLYSLDDGLAMALVWVVGLLIFAGLLLAIDKLAYYNRQRRRNRRLERRQAMLRHPAGKGL